MRVVVCRELGPPESLSIEEWDDPVPGPGQLLVDVHAAGVNFVDGGTLPTNPNGDAGFPVMARDATSGRIYLATLQFSGPGMNVFHSDDAGLTWSLPAEGMPGRTGSQDKGWIAVDNFAGAGNGNVYLLGRDFGTGNGIYFFRSTNQGVTFGPSGGTLICFKRPPIAAKQPAQLTGQP